MKRYIATYLLALIGTIAAVAQGDITVIDWDALPIDSTALPMYTETVPLASDYAGYQYAVKVEYPQWEQLTEAEAQAVRRFNLSPQLDITTSVATMNRRGMLDISFCPIVRSGKTYKKLLSGRITIESTRIKNAPRQAQAARASAQDLKESRLAKGRWVKISTTTEGMHRLTPEQLAKMGFSDPAKVQVYGYGGHILPEKLAEGAYFTDLPQVPVYRHTDGSLMFWMNGLTSFDNTKEVTGSPTPRHNTNCYARTASYFLTEGTAQLDSEQSSSAQPQNTLTTYIHTALYEKDEYSYAPMGRRLFEAASTATGTSKSYKLATPYPKNGATAANVIISFSASQAGTVQPTFNDGTASGTITMPTPGDYVKAVVKTHNYVVNLNGDKSGALDVKLQHSAFEGHLDYIEVTYERILAMLGSTAYDEIVFTPTATGTTAFKIDNPKNDELVVMRLPEPGLDGARIMPAANGTFVVDDPQHTYVAFRPSTVARVPQSYEHVPNQNLRADSTDVDMVIITPVSGIFDSEAQRLADAHAATDGLRCRVVRADQLYNEFSSGTPDVSAYRLYMKMLYDRQKVAPRYLLLFGDCAADNRMLSNAWKNYSPDNFLLCFEEDNTPSQSDVDEMMSYVSDTESYVCEDFCGMLDYGEGGRPKSDKPDVAVGRFTVHTLSEAKAMVDKTISHLKGDPGAWKNRVVFLGDDGDNNNHMDYSDRVARLVELQAPDLEVRRIMWDAYKRVSSAITNTFPDCQAAIKRVMQDGALMFNYTGHGATYVLSHESVLTLDEVKSLKHPHMPLWFTAACDVMPIDGTADNIGRAAVLNPKGGAVAFIGTTRTVYAAQNYTLNRYFTTFLFDHDEQGRRYSAANALRMAKNTGGVANTANKLHYVYVGDPSLVFGNPAQKVILDQVNGKPVPADDLTPEEYAAQAPRLAAGSKATMTGHVVDAKGNAMDNFNGTLAIRIMDSEVTVVCHNAGNAKEAFVFKDRNKVLYEGMDSVRNGRFSISFVVPVDINYSDLAGRANFFATSNDIEANGHSTGFIVGGTSNELAADTLGPKLFVTLDRDDFPAGGTTGSTPYFMASLQDDSGINMGAGGIGHNLQLCIDDNIATTYDLTNYYTAAAGDITSGSVSFPIPRLQNGEHTLTFRAWDLLNNQSVAVMKFVVDGSIPPTVAQVHLGPNPASTYTNIYVTHNSAGQDIDVEVNIYDYAGRLLNTFTAQGTEATPTVFVPWNLTTGNGVQLGAGVYLVRTRICLDGEWSDTETQKLFILRQ